MIPQATPEPAQAPQLNDTPTVSPLPQAELPPYAQVPQPQYAPIEPKYANGQPAEATKDTAVSLTVPQEILSSIVERSKDIYKIRSASLRQAKELGKAVSTAISKLLTK